MKRGLVVFIIASVLILSIACVYAEFELGDPEEGIETLYAPGGLIKGWVNISFDEQISNSIISDSFDNSISLLDLLKRTEDSENSFEYICDPIGCATGYSKENGATTKTINLKKRESKLLGFRLDGNLENIVSVNLSLTSDAQSSCFNQIQIDLLDDGLIDIGNKKVSDATCNFLKTKGCFKENNEAVGGILGNVPYCQRITLSESPGFKLGAYMKKASGANREVNIGLRDLEGEAIEGANCLLSDANVSWGEVSCKINYLVTESQEYYVCISSEEGEGEYTLSGYADEETGCGFHKTPNIGVTENAAYNISIEGLRFDAIGTLKLNNTLTLGNSFSELIQEYIEDTHGDLDCREESCLVPFRIIAGEDQAITLSNLSLVYDTDVFEGVTEARFYELTEIPSKISSTGFQKLYLDEANFSVSEDYGDENLEIDLDEENLVKKTITIEEVPVIDELYPTRTYSAYPTEFKINFSSELDSKSFIWSFGDGKEETTTKDSVVHIYNQTGNYKFKITIMDSKNLSSYKIFNIEVRSPEEIINSTLKKKVKALSEVQKQIQALPEFYQTVINQIMNIEEMNDGLQTLQAAFVKADLEEEYNDVLTKLLALNIPESVSIGTKTNYLSFYPSREAIDLDVLVSIGGGDYFDLDKEKYISAVYSWDQNKVITKIAYTEIFGKYDSGEIPIAKIFDLNITEQADVYDNSYIIMKKLDNLYFKDNYMETEEGSYVYMEVLQPENEITFSTTQDVDFSNLPLFISPQIDSLLIVSSDYTESGKDFKWSMFLLIIIFLALLGIGTYIGLQIWYKRKYEDYLFKNRTSLYNLINYIKNSKEKEMTDEVIESNLRKAGWNPEQIRYVMRKYSGKQTGMFELPVEKVLDFFKGLTKPKTQVNKPIPQRIMR